RQVGNEDLGVPSDAEGAKGEMNRGGSGGARASVVGPDRVCEPSFELGDEGADGRDVVRRDALAEVAGLVTGQDRVEEKNSVCRGHQRWYRIAPAPSMRADSQVAVRRSPSSRSTCAV